MFAETLLDNFLKQHLVVRILVCVLLTCVGMCALALFTFDVSDISWIHYATGAQLVNNKLGYVGAQLAATLLFYWGAISWLVLVGILYGPMVLLYQGTKHKEWERQLALPVGLFACTIMVSPISYQGLPGGGYVGWFLYRLLTAYLPARLVVVGASAVAMAMFALIVQCFGMRYVVMLAQKIAAFIAWCNEHQVVDRVVTVLLQGMQILLKPVYFLHTIVRQIMNGSILDGTDLIIPPDHQNTYDLMEQYDVNTMTTLLESKPSVTQSVKRTRVVESPLAEFQQQTFDFSSLQTPTRDDDESDLQINPASALFEREPFKRTVATTSSSTRPYKAPEGSLFTKPVVVEDDHILKQTLQDQARILEQKLERFGVFGKVCSIKTGPVVTLFEYEPHIDTKISKILALEDDLALALQALSIRIIAPIPGKSVVGFEVANVIRQDVLLASIIKSAHYTRFQGDLPLVLGKDTIGQDVIVDLVRMPHLLIAGSTGSGKSVGLNAMLISLLCKKSPDELKLILIDPKRLEFTAYADIPHLLFPLVTESKKVAPILRWVIKQMEERYALIAQIGARNLQDYNQKVSHDQRFAYIVVVIDELADLMMTVGREIEDLITRIAQMARAAGIHMIVATQRPSVDIITGLIKVNFPSRISFRVSSKIDSRTILDCNGADKLLGRGDMLFLDSTGALLKRVHGCYVSDEERIRITHYIRSQRPVEYLDLSTITSPEGDLMEQDEQLYQQVIAYLQEVEDISISSLQRKFRIGYNRSARIMSMLESQGMITPSETGKTRKVIK